MSAPIQFVLQKKNKSMTAESNNKLHVRQTAIADVLLLEPKIFTDQRGWLMESFNANDYKIATGLDLNFIQDNHTHSKQWTLRGLHYQLRHTQGKLVRVVSGSVFDVAVDMREDSATFGQWVGEVLSAENHRHLWIPPGYAHGYLVLSESADFLYKTTDYYDPESEVCLSWSDPAVGISWPIPLDTEIILSGKNSAGLSWDQAPKL